MKKFTFLIFLLSGLIINAQNNFSKKIKTDGRSMANSLIKKDYETLINFTYPKILELSGGKEKMIKAVAAGINKMENEGAKFVSVYIGKPKDIFKAGDELHCLVPQEITIEVPTGQLITNSFLLAVSMDQGLNWYYIDVAQLTKEKANTIFPNFNENLVFPKKTKPKFIPN